MNPLHHGPQDHQSLLMHREAVRLLQAKPELVHKAVDILAVWGARVSPRSKPLRDEWVSIIADRDWARALEESERGNQIRQASPLACLLPRETRTAIIRQVRDLKAQGHA